MDGPAAGVPEMSSAAEAGDTSSEDPDGADTADEQDESFVAGTEASIAVDPVPEVRPVKALQAL